MLPGLFTLLCLSGSAALTLAFIVLLSCSLGDDSGDGVDNLPDPRGLPSRPHLPQEREADSEVESLVKPERADTGSTQITSSRDAMLELDGDSWSEMDSDGTDCETKLISRKSPKRLPPHSQTGFSAGHSAVSCDGCDAQMPEDRSIYMRFDRCYCSKSCRRHAFSTRHPGHPKRAQTL